MSKIENSGYRKRYALYNSERREVKGFSLVHCLDHLPPGAEYNSEIDFSNSNVNIFQLDCTNHQSVGSPGNVTLFTFSNGCTIRGFYYLDVNGTELKLYMDRQIYDKDGQRLNIGSGYQLVSNPMNGWQNQSIDHMTLRWYPPSYYYQGDDVTTGTPASNFSHLGDTIGYTYQTVYDPKPLEGKVDLIDTDMSAWMIPRSPYLTTQEQFKEWYDAIIGGGDDTPISPIFPSEDTSTPGGGDDADPDYNPFSDPVDFPGLPTGGSALSSGFIRVYNPTTAQLNSLAGELWSSSFYNTIEKIMNDPMEAIISLHAVPFQIIVGDSINIRIGNYSTQVSSKIITTQYYTINCGNISIPEHWASALDYSPYTTVDIFIPFVGVRPLQIDDVMNKVLNLKYNIDILTGSAIAMLKCGDSVLYTYNTQVLTEIPYSTSSYGRLIQSIIGVAGTAIGATAGGAGAIIGSAVGGALGTAMTKHSDISRGGALGGAVGVMGDFTPYLIIHRPLQSLASGFASKKGYPANIGATLGSVSGFTVVDKIHLTGINCTDTERDEIHALLKDGVII